MVYQGTSNVERIFFNDDNGHVHWIEMEMAVDSPTFMVTCCCDEEFDYEFIYTKTNYEQIKFNIMESIFESDDVFELMDMLTDIFEDGFEDIMVEYECECDGDCENCECNKEEKNYLN